MNHVTLVIELPEGAKPEVKPFMEVLGGKVTAVAWNNALAKLDELEREEESTPGCGTGTGTGSVTPTDFKYAKMQTVHQLLTESVDIRVKTPEEAEQLARLVDAAYGAIDSKPTVAIEVSDDVHELIREMEDAAKNCPSSFAVGDFEAEGKYSRHLFATAPDKILRVLAALRSGSDSI